MKAYTSQASMFTSKALTNWARQNLSSRCSVLSDGLACFRSVVAAGCRDTPVVTGGRHPNELPQFRWINMLVGNLKTSFSGTFHAFVFEKYANRNLGGFCFLFNRHFKMTAMTEQIANAVYVCTPCPDQALRVVEPCAQSSHSMPPH
ncbi:MAG: transposase [Cyanobacteriota bacterium]